MKYFVAISLIIGIAHGASILNRTTVHTVPGNPEDANTGYDIIDNANVSISSGAGDDAYVAEKENTNSADSGVDNSTFHAERMIITDRNEAIAESDEVGINEMPTLVNMEYYQFPNNHNNEDFLDDLDRHVLDHQKDMLDHDSDEHLHKPYPIPRDMGHKYHYSIGPTQRGISFVPVLYQKKHYSSQIVYEPVYPNRRGFYVPTIFPQYHAEMNVRPKPANYPKVQPPVENIVNLQVNDYQ